MGRIDASHFTQRAPIIPEVIDLEDNWLVPIETLVSLVYLSDKSISAECSFTKFQTMSLIEGIPAIVTPEIVAKVRTAIDARDPRLHSLESYYILKRSYQQKKLKLRTPLEPKQKAQFLSRTINEFQPLNISDLLILGQLGYESDKATCPQCTVKSPDGAAAVTITYVAETGAFCLDPLALNKLPTQQLQTMLPPLQRLCKPGASQADLEAGLQALNEWLLQYTL